MAIESITKRITQVDKTFEEKNRGESAEAILKVLDPLIEERLGRLLNEFEKCPPDLGALLDLRAKITEVWRIRRNLSDVKKIGAAASKVIEAMIVDKMSSGNRTEK